MIWVSVSAAALTVSFSYFKKADKWLLPVGELLVGLVLSRKELYPGLAGLIRLVVQKINMYYNVQIVSGFERYLDLNPVVEVTAWLLVILSILQIYFLVVRKRLAGVLIPPLLLIMLDFAVGYAIKAGIDLFLTGCGRKLWLPGCRPGGIKAVGISKAESSMPFSGGGGSCFFAGI